MNKPATSDLLRELPSIDELLRSAELQELLRQAGHAVVTNASREVLARLRRAIQTGLDPNQLRLAIDGLAAAVEREVLRRTEHSLRPVINATGVILHTNLGRAPISEAAIEHVRETAIQYSNLEFDLEDGRRSKRDVHIQRLFRLLFGSKDDVATVVVNNNAAAVLLTLNTLAEGGEVVVSRGELVEIGGSFRIPEVMAKSGAVLHEVGTTNRTRIGDYERAISERTRLLLRVHRSNFEIVGFTETPALAELVELGRRHNIPVVEDLGSGALFDLQAIGVESEPTIAGSIAAGVDVITYSGDKLLGGPQAGLITGRTDLISRIRLNPLFRALRVDKLTYAALEATLLAYVRQDYDAVPALQLMRTSADELRLRAKVIAEKVQAHGRSISIEVIATEGLVGAGTAPGATIPSYGLAVRKDGMTANALAALLRSAASTNEPINQSGPGCPIIGRVEDDRVVLDLRTVFPIQDDAIVVALMGVASSEG